jgi:hypothetical protein
MVSIANETYLLLDILTNLLVPVAIAGDGPPLPHIRLRSWILQVGIDWAAPNRSEALARRQIARDYSQGRQPCLAELQAACFDAS